MYIGWGPRLTSFYNDAYVPILSGKHPMGLGQPYAEMFPELIEPLSAMLAATLAGEPQWFEDSPVPRAGRDGLDMRWFSFGWTPLRDEQGDVAGFFCATTETTDKVLAVRRLADEREGFAQLFEQAPTFMAVLRGPEHRIELANPGYLRLIGRSDVVGMTVAEALPDDVEQGYLELLDTVYRSGEAFSATRAPYNVQALQGAPTVERFVDFVFQPVKDAAGTVTGIFVEGVDVTDRALADQALRESESRLRALNADLEHEVLVRLQDRGMTWQVTPDLLGVLNRSGFLEKTNPAWQHVLGWSEDEIRRMPLFELLHPDDVLHTRGGFDRLVLAGEPAIRFENRYRCRDGSYRWLSWMGVPEGGKFYCRGRDITVDKERDSLLAARTAELDRIWRNSRDLLVTLDADGMFRSVSPAWTSILGHPTSDVVGRSLLEFVLPQDAARTRDGLASAVSASDLTNFREPLAAGPSVRTEVVGAGGLWSTLVDPSQLENASLNLCINARDAMMPSGGRLTIETANKWLDERAALARELPPGQYVSLCVSDTSTGMPPDVVARAFDPFFTTKPLGEGTGLGLSMIYGFVRQSGGQVRIYSELGAGTTMCVYLPRHLGAAESDDVPASLDDEATGAGETVLVVDDETTVRLLAVEVLEEIGYRVIEAADGPAGIRLLQSDVRIDLLVTDVGLPEGINGRQMADAGRVLRPDLQVLFITGYAENAVVGNGHLAPGMQVMAKPFELAALGNKVREMIEGRRGAG